MFLDPRGLNEQYQRVARTVTVQRLSVISHSFEQFERLMRPGDLKHVRMPAPLHTEGSRGRIAPAASCLR